MEKSQVIIIGAGISGLISALELEKEGYRPIILEKSDQVGGRLCTTQYKNVPLDHGFQVLLTNYPEAKKYLNMESLDLKYFESGAIIFDGHKSFEISDPLRDKGAIFKMLISPIGTLSDKIKLATLALKLKNKSLKEIFKSPAKTTKEYLKDYGFSQKIMSNFFKPFFGGIYLENELNTSSRMFEFVFKMFTEGSAAIPSSGIVAITEQLKSKLKNTEFRFNTEVKKVDEKIHLANNETLEPENIIIATQPETLMSSLGPSPAYQHVTNMYFSSSTKVISKAKIALVTNDNMLINNFYQLDSLFDLEQHVISVSINTIDDVKIETIKKELETLTGADANSFEHIETFKIRKALPVVEDLKMEMEPSAVKLHDKIILAGDYLLNGSLNAAMQSGRTAAQAVIGSW